MTSEKQRFRLYEYNKSGIPKSIHVRDRSGDEYRIPKNYKTIFTSKLNVKEDASKQIKDQAEKIRRIFATGVTEKNYAPFFHNLLWYEETIVNANMKSYNLSNVSLRRGLREDSYDLVVPDLSSKKKLSLIRGDVLVLKPRNNVVMFEAVITKIKGDVVSLKGLHPGFKAHFNLRAKFDVRFFTSRISFERMHRAVQGSTLSQRRVFPVANTNMTAPYKIQKFYNHLVERNAEQHSAVEHIVGSTAGTAPYLLHGPPGTGKTVTVVEAILQLVKKDRSNRIMVCTDSNMAADHVANSLIKYAHKFEQEKFLLRACSENRDWGTLPQSLVKYSNKYFSKSKEEIGTYKNLWRSHSIVITTLSYAVVYAKETWYREITHLFIDEAAQASEPACLIPIRSLLSTKGSLTLAGDPLQLGPVIMCQHAHKLGLGLSFMERLKNTCELYSAERNDANYTMMLRNNFRSDPAVLKIPNEFFYKGQLRALAAADPLSAVDILGARAHSRATVFHGVLSKEQRIGNSSSLFNKKELEIVQKYIKTLIRKHKVLPVDIGVVTPYLLQVSTIKGWLNETPWSNMIEVGTVEAFQGKEKRVIIISTVRSESQLGFLVDDQRFNVAVTRAKAKVVVIGNPLCLEKDLKWRTYMQQCREYGTYTGYDSATKDILASLSKDISSRLKIKA